MLLSLLLFWSISYLGAPQIFYIHFLLFASTAAPSTLSTIQTRRVCKLSIWLTVPTRWSEFTSMRSERESSTRNAWNSRRRAMAAIGCTLVGSIIADVTGATKCCLWCDSQGAQLANRESSSEKLTATVTKSFCALLHCFRPSPTSWVWTHRVPGELTRRTHQVSRRLRPRRRRTERPPKGNQISVRRRKSLSQRSSKIAKFRSREGSPKL